MMRKEFLLLLDDILEEDEGTLTGNEDLKELESWDSLAVMQFLALVDEEFEVILEPAAINECITINDLLALLDGNIKE